MGMSGGSGKSYQSEINVTPMVDIMLVLLIIFMVITPMLQAGVTVALPKANTPDEDPNIVKDTAVVVAIPDAKMYYVKKDLMPSLPALVERLQHDMKASSTQVVYIKASFNVPYGEVVQVVNAIRDANIDQIGLVADKNKKPGGGG